MIWSTDYNQLTKLLEKNVHIVSTCEYIKNNTWDDFQSPIQYTNSSNAAIQF